MEHIDVPVTLIINLNQHCKCLFIDSLFLRSIIHQLMTYLQFFRKLSIVDTANQNTQEWCPIEVKDKTIFLRYALLEGRLELVMDLEREWNVMQLGRGGLLRGRWRIALKRLGMRWLRISVGLGVLRTLGWGVIMEGGAAIWGRHVSQVSLHVVVFLVGRVEVVMGILVIVTNWLHNTL